MENHSSEEGVYTFCLVYSCSLLNARHCILLRVVWIWYECVGLSLEVEIADIPITVKIAEEDLTCRLVLKQGHNFES